MHSSRRSFFKSFLSEIIVLADQVQGKKNIPLNKLHLLPDEKVRDIIPIFFSDSDCRFRSDKMEQLVPKKEKYLSVRQLTESEQLILKEFKTKKTLWEVARYLSNQFEMNELATYEAVKVFFFELARRRICHPCVPIEINENDVSENNAK
jgi:hypothetical protein